MAKKLSEFIKALIVKAGGNPDDEALKDGLSNIGTDLEIADELVTSIDNGLLSIATAKNNYPELKNHYFAQAYKGLDSELDKLIESEKLPEDIVTQLRQESSSTKRAVLLATKIKELESKKANSSKGDTQKLNEQIVELNNQLRAEKDAKAALEQKHVTEKKEIKQSFALNQLLSGYKTIHDTLDPETKNIILNALIKKNLDAKNATWDIDENGNLKLIGRDNNNIFSEDNRLLTPKTFLDTVLANEKQLVINDANNVNNNNSNNNNSYRPNNGQHSNNGQQWQQNNNNGSHNNNNNGNRRGSGVLQELIQRSQDDLAKAANNGTRIV